MNILGKYVKIKYTRNEGAMDYTKDEIYDIFEKQILAKEQVYIEDFCFNTAYNYSDRGLGKVVCLNELLPTLQIKDSEKFKENIYNYIQAYFESDKKYTHAELINDIFFKEDNKLKYALTNLFINAAYEDFEDINRYVKMRTEFIKSDLVNQHKEWVYAGDFEDVKDAHILYRMQECIDCYETPDRLEVKVQRTLPSGEVEEMYMPSVLFGVYKNTAYVYTIQNLRHHKTEPSQLQTDLNRAKFKLNRLIDEDDQDIEPFSLVSASILTGFLKSVNVNKIQINNFLPIRYSAKESANIKRSKGDEDKLLQLQEEQQRIQDNLTSKFTNTFYRVAVQTAKISLFDDLGSGSVIYENKPDDKAGFMQLSNFLINLHDSAQQPNMSLEK